MKANHAQAEGGIDIFRKSSTYKVSSGKAASSRNA